MITKNFSSLSKKAADSTVTVGTVLHDFVVKKIHPIPELNVKAYILAHVPSKAQYMHVESNDTNNVFSIGFFTPVWDSKGTPHILEHTTLCGSRAFPVRDPFFKMLNRSLSTYMNAWTGSDFTMYPFATQNPTDFANLRSIYLDAVFNPLLDKYDFLQEGCRIEPCENDGENRHQFKGIVFNEMKGVFSSKESQFYHHISSNLLKGSTYGYESGGLPLEIPNLTHDELVSFHKKHYTLGNCKIFTFGNIPLIEHTQALSKSFSSYSTKSPKSIDVMKKLKAITTPQRMTVTCPYDGMADPSEQCIFSISFLGNDTTDAQETFNLQLICHLLFDGPSAPMFQELIDSNIGHEYSPGSGYESGSKVALISIGLQGISRDVVPLIEQKIFARLERVRSESFSKERVDAVVHQLNLSNRYHSAKFGLSLASSILPNWIRGNDPLKHLFLTKRIEAFQNEFEKNPDFISGMIDKYFLQNTHRLHLLMVPDESYNDILINEENLKLQEKLKDQNIELLKEDAKILASKQTEQQNVDVLPCLAQSDIISKYDSVSWESNEKMPQIIYRSPLECNGLTFSKSFFPMQLPTLSEIALLPLMTKVVNEIGIMSIPISEFTEQMKRTTGSISVGTLLLPGKQEQEHFKLFSTVSSHCLDTKLSQSYELASKICKEPNFLDHKRMETLLNAEYSDCKNSIADSGHHYAMSYAASLVTRDSYIADMLNGIRQIQTLKRLISDLQQGKIKYSDLSNTFNALFAKTFFTGNHGQLHFLVTGQEQINEKLFYFDEFIQKISPIYNQSTIKSETLSFSPSPNNALFELPFSTNYLGGAIKTVKFGHPDSFALTILAKLLKSQYLHREIREKGGAYGGGCSYSSSTGILSFYSYRDPNPIGSIATIENCLHWIRSSRLTSQNMLEAKLACFGELDIPIDFHTKDISYKLRDITVEEVQRNRDALLATTVEQVYQCAEKYLTNPKSYTLIGKSLPIDRLNMQTNAKWKIESLE